MPTQRKRPKHELTGEKSSACKRKCRKTSPNASSSVSTSDSLAGVQADHDMQQPENESNADQPQRPAASNIKGTGNNSLQNPIAGVIFYVVTL